jgi:hypothetical protein
MSNALPRTYQHIVYFEASSLLLVSSVTAFFSRPFCPRVQFKVIFKKLCNAMALFHVVTDVDVTYVMPDQNGSGCYNAS